MEKKDGPIVIGCIADERYAMHSAVMLYSAIANMDARRHEGMHVYFADAGLTTESRKRIRAVVEPLDAQIDWYTPDERLVADIPLPDWQKPATYYKLFLPHYLDDRCARLLYLDVDTVVLHDLSDLWETDLEGKVVGGVPDSKEPTLVERAPDSWQYYHSQGFSGDTPFYNGGVLLIDVDQWREKDFTRRVIEARTSAGHAVSHGDQDGLNLALRGNWKQLEAQWNVLASTLEATDHAEEGPHILHFAGIDPADPLCTHPAKPQFLRALRASGWFSPLGYRLWQGRQALVRWFHRLKDASRPMRHRLRRLYRRNETR